MLHSLRARLLLLWVLLSVAALVVAALLVQFQGRSAAAQIGRAASQVAQACDAIRDRFDFYAAAWDGSGTLTDAASKSALDAAVALALGPFSGVEGGIWQSGAGALAFVPGSRGAPPPQAEGGAVAEANEQAAREERAVLSRLSAGGETMLLAACPLGSASLGITGWAMARVRSVPGFGLLTLGLGLLLAIVLGAAAWLAWLAAVWGRHVGAIETALARHDVGALPVLAPTGERELDRIVAALNEAGSRLAAARDEAAQMSGRVAAAERLAALGRVAAGVAHEIRNPIAAMRLKAENALASDDARRARALRDVLGQIARLDALVGELLAMTQPPALRPERVDVAGFLAARVEALQELAALRAVAVAATAEAGCALLDPMMTARALDNILLNAIQNTPPGGRVTMRAHVAEEWLRVEVADTGSGVAPELRERLFEPFVTGRAEGTGLGLAIAREMVEAQGGRLVLLGAGGSAEGEGACFRVELPWRAS